MFSYIGEKLPKEAHLKVKIPSIMAFDQKYVGTLKQLVSGKRNFRRSRSRTFLRLFTGFVLDLYTEDLGVYVQRFLKVVNTSIKRYSYQINSVSEISRRITRIVKLFCCDYTQNDQICFAA